MRLLRPVGLVSLMLALLALIPTAMGKGTATDTWTGSWSSEWGTMVLTQTGSKIEGSYPHDSGHLVGSLTGNVLTGRWDEVPSRKGPGDAGAVILTLQGDGKSFKGRWTYDGTPNSWATNWNGRCTTGPCLQNTGANAQPAKRICTKTYVIEPSGAKIAANVKFVELDAQQKADLVKKEEEKYEGFPYTPISSVTRKQNCAGYVMARIFGPGMVQANVEPDGFFRQIVSPYGAKRLGRLTARAGDVVVYRNADGVVKHVAIVESNVVGTTILTKDGDERLYRATFPRGPLRLTNDPLVTAHTGNGDGTVEFWSLDRNRVSIRAVSAGPCDAD